MPLRSLKPDIAIPEISFPEHVLKCVNRYGDKTAFVDAASGREYTFAHVSDQIVKCASALNRLGIKKGDIVATCTINSVEYLVTVVAITACGAVVTTCNPGYTARELRHQFSHSEPRMVFCYPGNYEKIKEVSKTTPSVQHIFTIGEMGGVRSLNSLIENETGTAFPRVEFDAREDLAFLPYSSGTTGLPKGVMLTHYNAVALLFIARVFHNLPQDCRYSCVPIFHINGLMGCFTALVQGVKHVLDNRFNIKNMFTCIDKYKVTGIGGVPPMLNAMVKSPHFNEFDLTSLRSVFSAAAPLSPDVAKILSDKAGCFISQGWGLTEGAPITMGSSSFAPYNSVGIISPNTKLKVIDVKTGEELGPNQDGEFCAKGPQVMKGYYKNPKATSATIDVDGWLHTGDIGHYDENQMIYVIDRLKELIKYKGFQVAPAEIEAVLLGHPAIDDAAVIGIPHSDAGEVARGFIVKKNQSLNEKEVHDYLQDKLIKYKHLHGGIEFCKSIPKNATGKILRKTLRERVANSKL